MWAGVEAIIQTADDIIVTNGVSTDCFAAVVFKSRQTREVANDTKHFPRWSGLCEWQYNSIKALHTPFGANKCSRSLSKGRDRQ